MADDRRVAQVVAVVRPEKIRDPKTKGGPGDVTNPWAFALFAPCQEQFTIVQWISAARAGAWAGPASRSHRR